jgi:hypothetical protein
MASACRRARWPRRYSGTPGAPAGAPATLQRVGLDRWRTPARAEQALSLHHPARHLVRILMSSSLRSRSPDRTYNVHGADQLADPPVAGLPANLVSSTMRASRSASRGPCVLPLNENDEVRAACNWILAGDSGALRNTVEKYSDPCRGHVHGRQHRDRVPATGFVTPVVRQRSHHLWRRRSRNTDDRKSNVREYAIDSGG